MKKIDLHIHTIATTKDADFKFDLNMLDLYIKTLNLDAIAITNHNVFDKKQFEDIIQKIKIKVFPGVEVDLENGHIIVIADGSDLDKFEEQCGKLAEKIVDIKSSISYEEFIKIFDNYQEYLLIPHYKKKPALQQQIIKKFRKNIICGEVDSVKKFCIQKEKEDSLILIRLSSFLLLKTKISKIYKYFIVILKIMKFLLFKFIFLYKFISSNSK